MDEAAEITPIDGIVVSEVLEGLVGIRLAGSVLTTDLAAGQQVAFRPVDEHNNDDRFVGTVTSGDSPTQVTVLLDRVALTQMLTIKEREVSPISTAPGANEDGTYKWLV